MVSGHSHLPNDRDFGGIESARRRRTCLYVPEDWHAFVENAQRTNRFSVQRMTKDDFVSLDVLTSMIINRKVSIDGTKVEWLKIHWIRVEKQSSLQFKSRYIHNELDRMPIILNTGTTANIQAAIVSK